MLDLRRELYLFAQALDNSGDTDYWAVDSRSGHSEKLAPNDPRRRAIRVTLDSVSVGARRFPNCGFEIDGKSLLSGECFLTIKPVTLDADGRVSPVVLLFSVLGRSRTQAANALQKVPDLMGRTLSQVTIEEIARLERMLRLPRFILLPRLLFAHFWTRPWNPISLK